MREQYPSSRHKRTQRGNWKEKQRDTGSQVEIRDRTACFVKKRTGETHGRQRELIKSPGLCGSAFFGKFYVLNNVVLLIKGLWKIMKEKNEEKKTHMGGKRSQRDQQQCCLGNTCEHPLHRSILRPTPQWLYCQKWLNCVMQWILACEFMFKENASANSANPSPPFHGKTKEIGIPLQFKTDSQLK